VTLQRDNLLWLRGRAASGKRRSLSEALDQVVTEARLGGHPDEVRSVVGTVDIAQDDADLNQADAAVRLLFEDSLSRPFLAREAKRGG